MGTEAERITTFGAYQVVDGPQSIISDEAENRLHA